MTHDARPRRAGPPGASSLLPLALALLGGCVRADVVVVDGRTAFEAQAAGELPALEARLTQASVQPGAEPIPREALAASPEAADLGPVAALWASAETDQDRLDRWLVAGCVGEGREGLLVARVEACGPEVDAGEVARLVGRENVHRRQVWEVLAAEEPGATVEQARAAWRPVHLDAVVCGALVETAEGAWAAKTC